jgi:type I restriction enzyme M protein
LLVRMALKAHQEYNIADTTGLGARMLDLSSLETWLWDAACTIRGPVDAPKFKDYILPLIFLKRLSDVFDDEVAQLASDFGTPEKALALVERDHKLVRFFIPGSARWTDIARMRTGLGEYLSDAVRAVARENPKLSGVIDTTDFNATTSGQRILDDDHLAELVTVLNTHRLGLIDVEPDILGRAYEYLLRKFAEGQGSSAGEFYTPPEVAALMARILDPQPGQAVYDCNCGSAGLLIKAHLRLVEKYGTAQNGALRLPSAVSPLKLFGQEINPSTFAMARMNAFIHDMEADIELGDTMANPRFTTSAGALRRFDLVTANPMWNQKFPASTYENDSYGRFVRGTPPTQSADWGWIQHMYASLADTGKMAVVLDTGAVTRGSGNQGSSRERDIRKAFVDDDLIEAVFRLPDNIFYNTSSAGIILVINRRKTHPRQINLINGSRLCSKGHPKNYLEDEHISLLSDAYVGWRSTSGISAIVPIADVVSNDYNLSPSRYVDSGADADIVPVEEAVLELQEAEDAAREADHQLGDVLASLGLR